MNSLVEPQVQVFSPSPDLAAFVRHYYLVDSPNPGISQITAAWTKQLLVLQYGHRLRSSLGGAVRPVRDAAVNGAVTMPYFFQPEEARFRFFAIEFTDIGIYSLFRENSTAFVDTTVDAMGVIPRRKRQAICDALYETEDVRRKVGLVEGFLRSLIPDPLELGRIEHVRNAVAIIRESGGWISVAELGEILDISERHLRRQFREVTGLAPKAFARILRFSGSIDALLKTGSARGLYTDSYPDPEQGYVDQAHFNHEFKQFTGYAPGNLPAERFQLFEVYSNIEL
jgi:AraC-like DNA-binding protein